MKRFYLRLEGMNFDTFLGDTQDLSTIRGGGLLLLEAAERVATLDSGLETISLGASSGLFAFEAPDEESAANRRRQVAGALAEDDELRHGTFTVDVVADTDDFLHDKEALMALNRWRQAAAPSVAFPSAIADGAEPCTLDRLRPASTRPVHGGRISESVWQRREHGRKRKQDFYRRETGLQVQTGFSEDLEKLTTDPTRGNLDGKMAVIYADGNSFGRLNQKHATSPEGQRALDLRLQGLRRDVLREIVELALAEPAFREGQGGDGPLRLETLMWGGDEMAWVVPAWAGSWIVDVFFDRTWSYHDESLTHACGVVFCHHKAPIHRMRALAEELAELAKARCRTQDLVAYEVLESYDNVGDDLEKYREDRCPNGVEAEKLILEPGVFRRAAGLFDRLRSDLPTRKVHAATRGLFREPEATSGREGEIEPWLPPDHRDDFKSLLSLLGGEPVAWIHLSQLWDYLEPPTEARKGGNDHA